MKPLKGASEIEVSNLRRLIVRIGGHVKEGKTTWSLTAPVPLVYHDLNNRSEHVLDRFVGRGVYKYRYDKLMASEQPQWMYLWNQFKTDFAEAVENPDVRTIVIDTEGDLWELRRLAEFGRNPAMPEKYGPLNRDIRNIFDTVIGTDKNLIVVSELKKKYIKKIVRSKGYEREIGDWDGTYEFGGWSGTSSKVEVNMEAAFDPKTKIFSTTIINCGINAVLAGRVYEGAESNFPFLAAEVFPDTGPEQWGYDDYVAGL